MFEKSAEDQTTCSLFGDLKWAKKDNSIWPNSHADYEHFLASFLLVNESNFSTLVPVILFNYQG